MRKFFTNNSVLKCCQEADFGQLIGLRAILDLIDDGLRKMHNRLVETARNMFVSGRAKGERNYELQATRG